MERRITDKEACRNLVYLLDDVWTKGDLIVVERDGQPLAALVPLQAYELWKQERDAFFERIEQAAQRANMGEDEAMALALAAQRAVRARRRRAHA